MPELRLQFASNGDMVGEPVSRRALRQAVPIRNARCCDVGKDVRTALNKLNTYVHRNPLLGEDRDPGWTEYRRVMTELQGAGDSLRMALIPDTEQGRALARCIYDTPDLLLAVECTDEDVTPPLGFVFEGRPSRVQGPPSRSHFANFWLSRFPIHLRVQGGGCAEQLTVDRMGFKALYALHRPEFEDAVECLPNPTGKS
jgi:hypothetical protein